MRGDAAAFYAVVIGAFHDSLRPRAINRQAVGGLAFFADSRWGGIVYQQALGSCLVQAEVPGAVDSPACARTDTISARIPPHLVGGFRVVIAGSVAVGEAAKVLQTGGHVDWRERGCEVGGDAEAARVVLGNAVQRIRIY